ncbi:unnamed protein product [Rhizoctonia solani]|uniref:P-type ATPase A domain-containing protein n=1 Tax=Rhizoctonia solani TaxID=456999 RepID=A0A8H3HXZ6_9AGAM|nr:unnamed protein product [Rhizoctonia solani]
MVSLKIGDVVPTDCRLTEAINVSIDQAALTGESLPQSKKGFYPRFHYSYRRDLDNILMILIGGTPIAIPTVLSVTLAVGAQQLAKHMAIVTRNTAVEELAGVTILCSDKTVTLATNKLTIDKGLVETYGPCSPPRRYPSTRLCLPCREPGCHRPCVVGTLDDPTRARAGIQLLDFKPFNPIDKPTEITYREESSGKLKRVTKGMTELDHDNFEGEGNGFELIGLLAIFGPPREDDKQAIDNATALGVKVKMVTGDQLAIAKETGRRLGRGDHMYPVKVPRTVLLPAASTSLSMR